jgi:hypothetical protein
LPYSIELKESGEIWSFAQEAPGLFSDWELQQTAKEAKTMARMFFIGIVIF